MYRPAPARFTKDKRHYLLVTEFFIHRASHLGSLKNLYDELLSVGVRRPGRSPPDTASSSLSDDAVSVGVRRQNRSPPNTAMASLDDDVVSVGVRRQSRSPTDTATSSFLSEDQLSLLRLVPPVV